MGQRLIGIEKTTGMSIEDWAKAADLNWSASVTPSFSRIDGVMVEVESERHIHRDDDNRYLGTCTKVWKPVQPIEVLQWFEAYVAHDSKFVLDRAGCLQGGKRIFATARYNGDMVVAGDKHVMHLMMTTSFDQRSATINVGTATRWICMNQMPTALARAKAGKGVAIKTRHSSKFNAERVTRELADIVGSFNEYKTMGDAMAQHHMKTDETQVFLRRLLDIPTADLSEVNTRKVNQLNDLQAAYDATVREGTEPGTAWAALNAVTRYVDHTRGTRDMGQGETESRFFSAQFSSGAAMKAKAVGMLYELDDGALLKACVAATAARGSVSRLLSQPLMVR